MNMSPSKSICLYITYINADYCYVCRHTEVGAADWATGALSGLANAFALLRPMCPSAKHVNHFILILPLRGVGASWAKDYVYLISFCIPAYTKIHDALCESAHKWRRKWVKQAFIVLQTFLWFWGVIFETQVIQCGISRGSLFSFPQASCSPNRRYIEKPVTPVGICCTRYRMPRIRAWYSGSVRMLRLEDIQNGPGYRKHPSHLGFKPTAGEGSQGA